MSSKPKKAKRCPAILRCRDVASVRACLTHLTGVREGADLDYRSLTFIDPGAIALVHHVAHLRPKQGPVRIALPKNVAAKKYLMQHLDPQGGDFFQFTSPNTFPLRYVYRESHLIRELQGWRHMMEKSAALTAVQARHFSSTMSEVLINSFQHGKVQSMRRPCIVVGQTFKGKGHSMLVAVDSGHSIPETLIGSGKYEGERSDEEWVRFALQRGVTCGTRAANRGLGLYALSEEVKSCKGSMLLLSRAGVVTIGTDGKVECHPLGAAYKPFKGTMLILDLPMMGDSHAS